MIFVLRGMLFFGVRDGLLTAAARKWIRLGVAMSNSAQVNRASNTNATAAVIVMAVSVIFIVMFAAAAAFTSASTTSTRRTFARTAWAAGSFCERTSRESQAGESGYEGNPKIHRAIELSERIIA